MLKISLNNVLVSDMDFGHTFLPVVSPMSTVLTCDTENKKGKFKTPPRLRQVKYKHAFLITGTTEYFDKIQNNRYSEDR